MFFLGAYRFFWHYYCGYIIIFIAMRQLYPKYFVTVIAVIFCCSSYSCKKSATNPSLDFTWTGKPYIDSTITFHSNAPAGSTFFWKLGDGTNSTAPTPSHKYIYGDSFSVMLTLNNNPVVWVSKKVYIQLPLDFSWTGLAMVSSTISFQSTAFPGSNCTWDFGDGNTATGTTSNHIYSSAGSFIVTLVENNSRADTIIKTIYISVDPVYTHLIAGDFVFHHTYQDYTGYYVKPDENITITVIDPLTIQFGTVMLYYGRSTDSSLLFSHPPDKYYDYDYTSFNYNHISGNIDYVHQYNMSAGSGTVIDHYYLP